VQRSGRQQAAFATSICPDATPPRVAVSGEIDVATAHEFETSLTEASRPDQPLVIDLRDTSFMDSTGLSVLVRVAHVVGADADPQRLVVDHPCAAVYKTLTVSGVDRLLTITNPVSDS
jgi:anti-anti-sigma factor